MTGNRGKFTLEGAEAYLSFEPEIRTSQLTEKIWTASDGLYRTLFVEGNTGVTVFDTFGTPGRARAYRRGIARVSRSLIYSHDHLDHAGFAADFAPDAEIVADEICAKVVKARGAEGQLLPSRVLRGEANSLVLDGVELQLLNPGPTHGSGNLSAWFPEEKVFFSSDTILANARYGFLPDYHLANFVALMRGFLSLDWDLFVPGRYGLTDRVGFEKGCDYIEAVQTEAQNAFQEFVPIWSLEPMRQYVGDKLRPRFGDLEGFEEHVGMTAIRTVHHYLMGGWGLEDTPKASVLLADQVAL